MHRASHLPCRDWCLERVTGRAKDWPRRSRNSQKTLTAPEVHLDDRVNREATVEDSSVALVEKDRETYLILAHVLLFKVGDTEWVREQVRCLGSAVMLCKTDQEPALADLFKQMCALVRIVLDSQ